MRERLIRFMTGRNGNDEFNAFLLIAGLILMIIGSFFDGILRSVFMLPAIAGLAFAYFRMLSKNKYKRSDENGKYLRWRYSVLAWLRLKKERWIQRKDYKFFTCPSCRATLRVPRGHGRLKIVCRKCGTSFMGKT